MVRKAIVKDLCDKCLNDTSGDLETDADYCLVINVNGAGEIAIDLCLDHSNGMTVYEMIQEARDVQRADDTSKPGKHIRLKVRCPVCHKPYSEGSGMALHTKRQHPEYYNRDKVITTHAE